MSPNSRVVAVAAAVIIFCTLCSTGRAFAPTASPRRRRRQVTSVGGGDDGTEYTLEVSYEGRTLATSVRPGESILAALERTGTADRLSLPALPADCRRGNCLTCAGRHAPNSERRHLVRGEDGLTPHMSREADKRGYILTCSSYITGDGVQVQLNASNECWDELYRGRLEQESMKQVGRAAMAKVIRIHAERNLEEWAKGTEELFRKSE